MPKISELLQLELEDITGDEDVPVSVDGETYRAPLNALWQYAVDRAEAAANAAQDAAAEPAYNARIQRAALLRASLGYTMPVGLVDPVQMGVVDYENPYGFKKYSDGPITWLLAEVNANWREEWAAGDITYRDPATGALWRSIDPARWGDPTRQGLPFTTYYVRYATGQDNTVGGRGLSPEMPFKRPTYAINIARAAGRARIIVLDKFIGSDAQFDYQSGGAGAPVRITEHMSIVAQPDDGTGISYFVNMRESYTKASFAWQNMGNGIWRSNAAAVNDAAKACGDMFDLAKVDLDGAPTPMGYDATAYADEAAILAGLKRGYWHTNTATSPDTIYVRRFDDDEPDPQLNWAYTANEGNNRTNVEITDGKVGHLKGFARLGGNGGASNYAWNVNPPGQIPANRIEHTGAVWFEGCDAYGASGGGFYFRDVARGGCSMRICKHNRDDGFNNSTLYSYTNVTGPSRTLEGRYIHLIDFAGLTQNHGLTQFRYRPALAGSSNGVTEHSQCRTTSLSSITLDTHGCPYATVSGARGYHFAAFGSNPTIPDAPIPPRAVFWADGTSEAINGGALDVETRMNIIGGGCPDSAQVFSFAATNNAKIRLAGYKGQRRIKPGQNGTVTDVITGTVLAA